VAVKIRLKRMGAKKRPFYRVVVADARSPRDGRFIESVGFYDPLKNPKVFQVDDERIKHWMATGARPSDAVRELLERQGSLPATAHPVRTKTGPKRAPKASASPVSAKPAVAPAESAPPGADEEVTVTADAGAETAEEPASSAEPAEPASSAEPEEPAGAASEESSEDSPEEAAEAAEYSSSEEQAQQADEDAEEAPAEPEAAGGEE
jgi:small subunit ribosomal protein S16